MFSRLVQAVACTVLHLCRVSLVRHHGTLRRGFCRVSTGHVTRMGLRITRGLAGAHTAHVTPHTSHRTGHVTRMGLRITRGLAHAHTVLVTPCTSRDQNGPQDNPGAGLRSHRAGTGSSAGQPFFCCRAASPVLGSVGLCGPSRDPCRGGSQVPPAAIWGCLRRPRGRNAARLGLGSGSGRYVLFGARFEAQTAVRRTETET